MNDNYSVLTVNDEFYIASISPKEKINCMYCNSVIEECDIYIKNTKHLNKNENCHFICYIHLCEDKAFERAVTYFEEVNGVDY